MNVQKGRNKESDEQKRKYTREDESRAETL